MKKGSGDDPFANEGSEVELQSSESETRDEIGESTPEILSEATSTGTETTSSVSQPADDLPYLARRQLRNKSVKTDRDQIPFFLRSSIQEGERDLRREVEDSLSQEVNKTDLREAAYVYAQRHPGGVVEVLREWGIEYLE
ncbi:hypothetical protein [Halococcus salsus]|uniref:hypothetical protein n=1 Tax=Halococcus salsus TaxID=2162894 RepID=UPI0013583C76|nr:hypothetical protein [Halococcus salsus]